jgi:hypothetical protein
MKLVSLNIGLPREVTWRGRKTTTAIYKQPVGGRVTLRKLNLDGDRQADLTVHGGEHKAAYCYPFIQTTSTGRESCPAKSCRRAPLERTLRRMVCRKTRSILAIGSLSVLRKWW